MMTDEEYRDLSGLEFRPVEDHRARLRDTTADKELYTFLAWLADDLARARTRGDWRLVATVEGRIRKLDVELASIVDVVLARHDRDGWLRKHA